MIDLAPACRRMVDVLAGIGDDQLVGSTPCTDYTVGDLIGHIDQVSEGFTSLARKAPDTGAATAELGHAWRSHVAERVQALAAAWGDAAAWQGSTEAGGLALSNELWGKIALTEIVVHGWDLAKATGQHFDLPDQTLQACLDHVVDFVPNAPVPELWGPAVAVTTDAALLDRVVAATGRTP